MASTASSLTIAHATSLHVTRNDMAIQSNVDMSALRKYAHSKRNLFEEAVFEAYKTACIKLVQRAKQTNTYMDQTHALRSSIGCVIYHKGVEVYNYFESTGGEGGAEGVQNGLSEARRIAEQQGDKTFVAVAVAGMHYAIYVESRGYDVLTGSTRQFTSDLNSELRNVKSAFKSHIEGVVNGKE